MTMLTIYMKMFQILHTNNFELFALKYYEGEFCRVSQIASNFLRQAIARLTSLNLLHCTAWANQQKILPYTSPETLL